MNPFFVTKYGEKLGRAMSLLHDYNSEKCGDLIAERYRDALDPVGLANMFLLVENDVRKGLNGFTGKKITRSNVRILPYEVIGFAREMRGPDFAKEVESFYLSEAAAHTGV